MTEKRNSKTFIREMDEPFVADMPSGARTRTKLAVTPEEEMAIREIGHYLGEMYRKALSDRIGEGEP